MGRPSPTIVVHLVGPGREWGQVELSARGLAEEIPDPLVEFGPEIIGVDLVHLAADDLVQVRLDHEPQERPGAVVEEEGLRDEPVAGLFDEARLDGGRADAELEVVGGDPLGRVAEGQGVQEDRPGNVGVDRKLAGEELQVEFLGGRLGSSSATAATSDLRAGVYSPWPEPGRDLVADRAEPGVDVMRMDRESVGRLVPPEDMHRPGQQPQHAPGALERAQGRQLLGQDGERLRMERVTSAELVP